MVELLLLAPEAVVETVSDALIGELGALSVALEDADADTANEQAQFGEPGMASARAGWQRSRVRALFDDEPAATEALTLLLAQDWAHAVHVQSIEPVENCDWVRLTQAQFSSVPITPDFWIVPSWRARPASAARVIHLDPGLAVGTRTHPTTRQCRRWIADQAPRRAAGWTRVLDYGCGSGILAIGAALHGAGDIDAVDIDRAAIEATRANAQANGVALNTGLPDMASGAYSLVFANILATPLKLLAPVLCAHVAAGGDLVLAGILERQADALIATYAPWLDLQVADLEEDWILMTSRRLE